MLLLLTVNAHAQIDEDPLGGWYAYSFNTQFDTSRWGIHFDISHRNFDVADDFQQRIVRGGATYRPSSRSVLWTFGYARSVNGEIGPGNSRFRESRLYQEAVMSQRVGSRVFIGHRFRFEQRWIDNQDFRTRFRYLLSASVPLNRQDLGRGAFYLSFYNEILLNGNRDIGDGRRVDTFDGDRLFAGVGYSLSDELRLQGGVMYLFTNGADKGQLLISLQHSL